MGWEQRLFFPSLQDDDSKAKQPELPPPLWCRAGCEEKRTDIYFVVHNPTVGIKLRGNSPLLEIKVRRARDATTGREEWEKVFQEGISDTSVEGVSRACVAFQNTLRQYYADDPISKIMSAIDLSPSCLVAVRVDKRRIKGSYHVPSTNARVHWEQTELSFQLPKGKNKNV